MNLPKIIFTFDQARANLPIMVPAAAISLLVIIIIIIIVTSRAKNSDKKPMDGLDIFLIILLAIFLIVGFFGPIIHIGYSLRVFITP